jgi:hypothetical protein
MNPSILEFLKEREIGKAKVRESKVVSHLLDTRLVSSHEHPNIEQIYPSTERFVQHGSR